MDVFEARTHSFVVRVWLEEADHDGTVTWRGMITHVPSNERHYFTSLEAVAAFIAPFLEDTRKSLHVRWRGARWWNRLRA